MFAITNPARRLFATGMVLAGMAVSTHLIAGDARATQFVYYFNSTISNGMNEAGTAPNPIGAIEYDPVNNVFWTAGFGTARHFRRIAHNGSTWGPTGTLITSGTWQGAHVTTGSWGNYIVSDNTQTSSNPNLNDWSAGLILPAAMQLNPQPITINGQTHAAGSLMLVNHFGTVLNNGLPTSNPGRVEYPQHTKRFYWYNLTETGQPTPVGPNSAPAPSTVYTNNGVIDWNEQFHTIITHQNMQVAAGTTSNSSNMGRDFAFSSDGQSIYFNDMSADFGGLYKVNLTTTGDIQRVVNNSGSGNTVRIEPSVLSTSVHNYGVGGAGDQVVYRGSIASGNPNGIDLFLDDGATFHSTPLKLFTQEQFMNFAETTSSNPIASQVDADGNIYIYDTNAEMIYRYDTQGRFVKIASEEQRDSFTWAAYGDTHNSVSEMQFRVNTTAKPFPVKEMIFKTSAADAPVGMLIAEVGDFNFDGVVDDTDKQNFLAALRPRGVGNPGASNQVYDLNGNSTGATTDNNVTLTLAASIIDWKDVKILQTFLEFPNGDTNLDGLLDFTDLNTMRDNYYTLGGPADKTWAQGDFASLDPFSTIYDALASDANIVNEVDLQLLAHTWLDVLGQDNITWSDLDTHNYEGQFRLDVIAAFGLESLSLPAVPEPGSCALLTLGVALLARRRRRARRAASV